jgi:hypothetical protein
VSAQLVALAANSTAVPADPAPAAPAANFTCLPYSPYNLAAAFAWPDWAAPATATPAAGSSSSNSSSGPLPDLSGMAVVVQPAAPAGGQPYGSWKLWTTDPYNFTVLRWNATEAEVAAAANDQLLYVAGQTGYGVSVARARWAAAGRPPSPLEPPASSHVQAICCTAALLCCCAQ